MKLVIDLPGLDRDHVPDVAEALDYMGFDAVIVGVAEKTELGTAGDDGTLYSVTPLEAR